MSSPQVPRAGGRFADTARPPEETWPQHRHCRPATCGWTLLLAAQRGRPQDVRDLRSGPGIHGAAPGARRPALRGGRRSRLRLDRPAAAAVERGGWALEVLLLVQRWLAAARLPFANVRYDDRSYLVRPSTDLAQTSPRATSRSRRRREAHGLHTPTPDTCTRKPAPEQSLGGGLTQPPESRLERWRRHGHRARLYVWAFLSVALLAVLVVLISRNTRAVKLDWVFGSTSTRRSSGSSLPQPSSGGCWASRPPSCSATGRAGRADGRTAPGGVEPPHAASKAAALSAELRGRAGEA